MKYKPLSQLLLACKWENEIVSKLCRKLSFGVGNQVKSIKIKQKTVWGYMVK
jgi:hypothetical protein